MLKAGIFQEELTNQSFDRRFQGSRPRIGPSKGSLIIVAKSKSFRRVLQEPNNQSFDRHLKGDRPRIGPFKGGLIVVANNQSSSGGFFRSPIIKVPVAI